MSLCSSAFLKSRHLLGTIGVRRLSTLGTSVSSKSSSADPSVFPPEPAEGQDPVTHTGQTFDKDDYRLVRFTDKEKQVNQRFAINLIASVPPTDSKKRVVSCDGGGGPLGHPKVYINLDAPGNHSCGYCGLRFKKEDHHH